MFVPFLHNKFLHKFVKFYAFGKLLIFKFLLKIKMMPTGEKIDYL